MTLAGRREMRPARTILTPQPTPQSHEALNESGVVLRGAHLDDRESGILPSDLLPSESGRGDIWHPDALPLRMAGILVVALVVFTIADLLH
jgi:hypothetical protein